MRGGAGGKIASETVRPWCADGSCDINGGVRVVAFDMKEVEETLTANEANYIPAIETVVPDDAVEMTLDEINQDIRTDFYRQFPDNYEEGIIHFISNIYPEDGFVTCRVAGAVYQVNFTFNQNRYSFDPFSEWQEVRERTYPEPVSEPIVNESISEVINMDELEKAKLRIQQLESELATSNSELEAAQQTATEAQIANKDLTTRLATAVGELAIEKGKSTVSAILKDVNFINPEAEQFVVEMLQGKVELAEDGAVNLDVVAEAAKPYTDGTSQLVASVGQPAQPPAHPSTPVSTGYGAEMETVNSNVLPTLPAFGQQVPASQPVQPYPNVGNGAGGNSLEIDTDFATEFLKDRKEVSYTS